MCVATDVLYFKSTPSSVIIDTLAWTLTLLHQTMGARDANGPDASAKCPNQCQTPASLPARLTCVMASCVSLDNDNNVALTVSSCHFS